MVTAAGRRHLRSSDVRYTQTVTRTSTRFGDRCFQSAAACTAMEQNSSSAATAGRDILKAYNAAKVTFLIMC